MPLPAAFDEPDLTRAALRGFSLVELLIFIVVVSAALAGVLRIFNEATARSADPAERRQALAIAESLLEEVSLMPFTFCDMSRRSVENDSHLSGCVLQTFSSIVAKPDRFDPPETLARDPLAVSVSHWMRAAREQVPDYDAARFALLWAEGVGKRDAGKRWTHYYVMADLPEGHSLGPVLVSHVHTFGKQPRNVAP